jgi:hypothetical protein
MCPILIRAWDIRVTCRVKPGAMAFRTIGAGQVVHVFLWSYEELLLHGSPRLISFERYSTTSLDTFFSEQWASQPALERILWVIALASSFLFLLHSLFAFFGGGDDGMDGDSGDGQMFTLKNLIVFFVMFGWVGLGCMRLGMSPILAIILGGLAGAAMVAIMMFFIARISGMKHSGTLQHERALGLIARTYLSIPAARGGIGKVHVKVQGGVKELDAITDHPDPIASSTLVKVEQIIDGRILLVTTKLD